MADLKFDTCTIVNAAKDYRDCAASIKSVEDDLKKRIQDLKNTSWKSTAGEAFQDMYQDDWAEIVDKYVAVLMQLADLLDQAEKDYNALAEKAMKIKIDSI